MYFLRASAHESVRLAGYSLAPCWLLVGLPLWVATQKKCLGLEWGAHLPCMAAPGPLLNRHLSQLGANLGLEREKLGAMESVAPSLFKDGGGD